MLLCLPTGWVRRKKILILCAHRCLENDFHTFPELFLFEMGIFSLQIAQSFEIILSKLLLVQIQL